MSGLSREPRLNDEFLRRVYEVASPSSGKSHAIIVTETPDGKIYTCAMPGCELCEIALTALALLRRKGLT